jgi:FtsH-binding integral membrane protein
MADFDRNMAYAQTGEVIDQGLRKHMAQIFNLMALSLFVSGSVAYLAAASGYYSALAQTSPGLLMVLNLAPLGILFFLMFKVQTLQQSTLQILFWSFMALEGFSLGYVSLLYTGESIVRVFLITAITFSGCALYGYTTKRDLSPFATFFMVALIGLIVAMIVNLFMQSTVFHYAVSALGVLLFAGITAWDVQNLKNNYLQLNQMGQAGTALLSRSVVLGALSLYINFLNMFLLLLQFFGDRR